MGVYMYYVCTKLLITLERSDKLKCFCTANETLKLIENWKFRTKYFQAMDLIKVEYPELIRNLNNLTAKYHTQFDIKYEPMTL